VAEELLVYFSIWPGDFFHSGIEAARSQYFGLHLPSEKSYPNLIFFLHEAIFKTVVWYKLG
jgi:hypothetical protein